MSRIYKTVSGDAWDLIAYKQMGNESYMKLLLEANRDLVEVLRFEAGVSVVIPDVPATSAENLPFWHSSDDNTKWGSQL